MGMLLWVEGENERTGAVCKRGGHPTTQEGRA